eukprot:GSMAST32.ASY1.ANO1.278.1 assembled CDS
MIASRFFQKVVSRTVPVLKSCRVYRGVSTTSNFCRSFSSERAVEINDVDAPKEPKVEEPEAVAKDGAKSSNSSFQAETSQLLDIVTNSLYTDKEVFLRELISNASDAIEKARHLQVTGASIEGSGDELSIRITTDETAGTITIHDAGCGMSEEELHNNIGTIARSGTKQFVKSATESSASSDVKSSLIGQFGVGFYASFMVADKTEEPAQLWSSNGVGSYDIVEAEGVQRDFSKEATVRNIIKKYSNFKNLKSLFYVGNMHTEKMGMGKMDPGVNLYSRKVLIDSKAKLLPEWLRFVHGVVDSEDIPLNISREGMQDSLLIRRISKYLKFYDEYNQFLKEGVCTDFENKNDISKLLRFESSALPAGELTSLDEYITRCPPSQKNIYYLYAPERHLAEQSAYYEVFKKHDAEVLFMYMPIDDFVMTNVGEFNSRPVIAESADVSDLTPAKDTENENDSEKDEKKGLQSWLKDVALENKIAEVNFTDRLYDSPAIIVDHESGALRRMMVMAEHQQTRSGSERMSSLPKQIMELNPEHPIIVSLASAKNQNPEMAKYLFDNCLVTAGLMDDSKRMLPRMQKLMEAAIKVEGGK